MVQNNAHSGREGLAGLRSIPWGSTGTEPSRGAKVNHEVNEKQIPVQTTKRIYGFKQSTFILFVLLGLLALAITIIAVVVGTKMNKSSRYV